MQLTLGIPQIDVKKTRRALYAYLAVYRRYRQQLDDENWRPEPRAPLKGFEKAMDPKFIHGNSDKDRPIPLTPEEYREAFVQRVDRKVERLPPYGREVIKRRLLTPISDYRSIHELPCDAKVIEDMKDAGWHAETRYYEAQKAEAIQMLAEMLRIAVYKE